MTLTKLKNREDLATQPEVNDIYIQFNHLLDELDSKNLPDSSVRFINESVAVINSSVLTGKNLRRLLLKELSKIVSMIEKEHKIVPRHYYRNSWIAAGLAAFGIPIGIILGLRLGSLGFLGIGFPIGLAIGAVVGSEMDKKAAKEGRQLKVQLKKRF